MKKLLLVIIGALLLSFPWMEVTSITVLFAFVPLLWIQRLTQGKRFMPWVILTMLLWNTATTFWVSYSTLFGGIGAIVVTSLLMAGVFWIYNAIWRRASRALAYTFLVAGWIGFEYFYLNAEVSWPWLTLGYGFSGDVKLIQWYEFLGSLGGSLWAWICNLLIFKAFEKTIDTLRTNKRYMRRFPVGKYWIGPSIAVLLPVTVSLIMYYSYQEIHDPVTVSVLQPNIDPYNEKFGGMDSQEQLSLLLEQAAKAPDGVQYFIGPETALDGITEELINRDQDIVRIREFLQKEAPQAKFIIGATTYTIYPKNPGQTKKPTYTARTSEHLSYYYDLHNTSLQIDTSLIIPVYHKSVLVIGVEKLPYPKYLGFLEKYAIDLGGASGSYAGQEYPTVFGSDENGIPVGAAICYEGIYGEYYKEFAKEGAQLMFIISNDGWWSDTYGHRLLFQYARLRAVETRRSIARSANTGTSGFINQRGDVLGTLGWDIRDQLTETINRNRQLTFYTKYGDIVGRVALYLSALCLLYYIAFRRRSKDHFYQKG